MKIKQTFYTMSEDELKYICKRCRNIKEIDIMEVELEYTLEHLVDRKRISRLEFSTRVQHGEE